MAFSLMANAGGGDKVRVHANGNLEEAGIEVYGTIKGTPDREESIRLFKNELRLTKNFTGPPVRIFGFAKHHPPTLYQPIQGNSQSKKWTPRADDILPITFLEEYLIPIKIWIVIFTEIERPGDVEFLKKKAIDAVGNTNEIWERERQGIALDLMWSPSNPEVKTLSMGDPANVDFPANKEFLKFDCNNFSTNSQVRHLQKVVGFEKDMINVYYMLKVRGDGNDMSATSGVNCDRQKDSHAERGENIKIDDILPENVHDKRIIALGVKTDPNLLIHELGHAFGLVHHPRWKDEPQNVMYNKGSARKYLTEGQTFRQVRNAHSMLQVVYKKTLCPENPAQCLTMGEHPVSEFPKACPVFTKEDTTTDELSKINCPPIDYRLWDDGE
ncbi:hypothetical protein [Candidatus Nitronereus thalassa]|uniref:Peptidase M12A domain-containing protein n=1 Tax=Candidatus Nitronereus thalassa TaxID=3020898 RepID=A0ABU3K9E7_9BACT|nr:hypothetical protein [Candidatus Nitronereus thalassa]MDT7043031.1 hypothetical protein [Candidatus Nitronereus thalassa]